MLRSVANPIQAEQAEDWLNREADALTLLVGTDVLAPGLVAVDPTAAQCEYPSLLMTHVAGRSVLDVSLTVGTVSSHAAESVDPRDFSLWDKDLNTSDRVRRPTEPPSRASGVPTTPGHHHHAGCDRSPVSGARRAGQAATFAADGVVSVNAPTGNRHDRWLLGTDMTTTTFDPRALLAESNLGVLATIKADGRPQLSPVQPFYDTTAGLVYVSMTEGRAKTANLRRDPRATLEVTAANGRSWATAEGVATLTGPGDDPHGPEVQALVDYYRLAAGEHPDWDEYRAVMVADRRVLMVMTVDHVYGQRIG